jgi:hypothetical protein
MSCIGNLLTFKKSTGRKTPAQRGDRLIQTWIKDHRQGDPQAVLPMLSARQTWALTQGSEIDIPDYGDVLRLSTVKSTPIGGLPRRFGRTDWRRILKKSVRPLLTSLPVPTSLTSAPA